MVLALAGTATGRRSEGTAELLPRPGGLDRVRLRPGQRRPSRRRPTPVTSTPSPRSLRKLSPKIAGRQLRMSRRIQRDVHQGWLPLLREGGKLHDPFRGAQLKAALAFLKAHRGQVSPITLTLWGNDLAPLSARGQGCAQGDRVVRLAPRLDPRAASVSRTDRRDHRDRSLEPGGRSGSRRPSRSTARSTRQSHEPRPLRERGSRRCTPSSTRPGTSVGSARSRTSARRAIRIRMTPGTGRWRTPSSLRPATA